MGGRENVDRLAQATFEEKWRQANPWEMDGAEFDLRRYERQFAVLADRHYGRVLEIGCGAGHFSRMLSPIADRVVALDIAPSAIIRAQAMSAGVENVDFRVANVMAYEPRAEGHWDLIVMAETIYCLGWLYSCFEVGWLMAELFAATQSRGRFLMVNTYGGEKDYLLRPWLIDTYRDLLRNVGYKTEVEERFSAVKNGVDLQALVTLFVKESNGEALSNRQCR